MVVRPRCCARVGCCQYYEGVSRNANTFSVFWDNLLELVTTKVYVVKLFWEALRSKEPSVASAETTRIGEANQVASSK